MELARQGARYFVAEKTALGVQRGFEADLQAKFPVIKECDTAVLFELEPVKTVPDLRGY